MPIDLFKEMQEHTIWPQWMDGLLNVLGTTMCLLVDRSRLRFKVVSTEQ